LLSVINERPSGSLLAASLAAADGRESNMEAFFFLALVVVVFVLYFCWHFGRSNSLLHQWAAENRYHILSQEYRSFFKGPYFWTSTKGQTVYYVVVEDSDGNKRSSWVRCGGWWFGLLSDNVEARWDD
jgi:hypothetical protein